MRYLNAVLNCVGTNFIGLPGCTDPLPDSALYLYHVPGIGQVLAAKVVSDDDVTAAALFRKVYREGIIRVTRDFFALAAKKNWQLRSQLDSEVVGTFQPVGETITLADPAKISVLIERCDSYASGLLIDFVRVYAENAGTIVITIDDGGTITTQSWTVAVGSNTLMIDYLATSDIVRISTGLVDTDEEDEVETVVIRDSVNCGCRTGAVSCGCNHCYHMSPSCHFSIKGQESADGTTWTDSETLNGFQISVECVADISYVICKFRYELAEAFRLAMAIGFFHELLQSRRGNPWADNASKDLAREQLLILSGGQDPEDGRFVKGEYQNALNDALNMVNHQLGSFGIMECTRARLVTSLP